VTKAVWKSHGEQHEVTGVGLDKVLAKFGFEPGPMGKDVPKKEKRRGWRKEPSRSIHGLAKLEVVDLTPKVP
jgi:hypothetical protein